MLTLALGLSATFAILLYLQYLDRSWTAWANKKDAEAGEFRTKYLDALASITSRAEAAEQLAASQALTIHAFRDSIGDRKLAEGLAAQIVYLQERLTESQRAVVTLTDLRAGQAVVRQGQATTETPEAPPRQTLWALASGQGRPTSSAPQLSVSDLKKPHGD